MTGKLADYWAYGPTPLDRDNSQEWMNPSGSSACRLALPSNNQEMEELGIDDKLSRMFAID